MSRPRGPLTAVAWFVGLVSAIKALTAAGHGALAAPPLRSATAVDAWMRSRPPETALFVGLRVVALILAWYLLGASLLTLGARVTNARHLLRVVDAMTPAGLRRLLGGVAGAALVAAPLAWIPSAAAASVGGREPPGMSAPPTTSASPGDPPVLRIVTPPMVPDGPSEPASPSAPPPISVLPATWTVRPGDSFWRIAEEVLAIAWSRPATDTEVVPFWRELIAENRGRLVVVDNSDLVYPGQVFVVPPPPRP